MSEQTFDLAAFKREQERRDIVSVRLPKLYHEREEIRSATRTHDTSLTAALDQEIVKLEKTLRDQYSEPYHLSEARYASGLGRAAASIWEESSALVSELQRLSSLGDTQSREFRDIARSLEARGVSFASLYSDNSEAFIIKGEEGMVHRDIRRMAIALREQGVDIPQRPDVSGELIVLPEGSTVFRADDYKLIMTTKLRVDRSGYCYASVRDANMSEHGVAQLAGPELGVLVATSNSTMEQFLRNTRGRLR